MLQSSPFNDRLQQLRDGNPTYKSNLPQNSFHETLHAAKKLCIVWESGRKMLFFYSYLIAVDLQLNIDPNVLTLQFMSHCVTLKGYHLDLLFTRFILDEPHVIAVSDQRYAAIRQTGEFFVVEATV